MVALENLAGVAVIALGMVLSPGPNMIYLTSRVIFSRATCGAYFSGGCGPWFCVLPDGFCIGFGCFVQGCADGLRRYKDRGCVLSGLPRLEHA